MLKRNKTTVWITSALILLPILFGVYHWSELPMQMPTHWGIDGTVDGWSSRTFAVFGLPLVIFAFHWLCIFFTEKDPKNKGQNPKVLRLVLWITPVVSLLTCGMSYAAALGTDISPSGIVLFMIGLLFVVVGNYLPKCKQSRTIGIKIKWTLENEANWNATHRFSGKLWVAGGLLLMFGAFLPGDFGFLVLFVTTLLMTLIPVYYSYRYSKKQ